MCCMHTSAHTTVPCYSNHQGQCPAHNIAHKRTMVVATAFTTQKTASSNHDCCVCAFMALSAGAMSLCWYGDLTKACITGRCRGDSSAEPARTQNLHNCCQLPTACVHVHLIPANIYLVPHTLKTQTAHPYPHHRQRTQYSFPTAAYTTNSRSRRPAQSVQLQCAHPHTPTNLE